ncbi:MAG: TatD DNase family protein, partial [Pseudonocardiales bacterium]|nr:TatD DNase family protein [Pseudonocardiales bacterium]
ELSRPPPVPGGKCELAPRCGQRVSTASRTRANEPYSLPWTVRGIAAARGVDAEVVAEATRANAERVFRLAEA